MLVITDHDTFANVLHGVDRVLRTEDDTFELTQNDGTARQRSWVTEDGVTIARVVEYPHGQKAYRIEQSLKDQLERA